nr:hypothetical protein [Tetragenococcus halophilus]
MKFTQTEGITLDQIQEIFQSIFADVQADISDSQVLMKKSFFLL